MISVISRESVEDIADAIRTKLQSEDTYRPSEMASAILSIPTGGGGDTVPILSEAAWEALTTAQKRSYGLVAIQSADSGFERGLLVNGTDYVPFNWGSVTGITISGRTRGQTANSYVQLGDIRFSDGTNYLASQKANIASSTTTYGSWNSAGNQGNTQYLFDNTASSKTISSGTSTQGAFEWITTFTTPIDLTDYTTLELWTANDAAERDPYYDVVITFYSNSNSYVLTIGETDLPTTRSSLGYTNNSYQGE